MSDDSSSTPDPADGVNPRLTRRSLLFTGAAAGAAALYGPSAARAMRPCRARASDREDGGTVTFGSNDTDPVPKKASRTSWPTSRRRRESASRSTPSTTTRSRSRSTATCRGSRTTSSPGSPDTGCSSSQQKGLATPIDDVWKALTPLMPPAMKAASTGLDGHQYFVPIYNYPWAVFYRKSVFKQKGYTVPTTWDQFIALAKKMKADGMTPIAFTDKDGWPAMGTFDILNMRINGYQFHVDLMAGKHSWNSPQVKAVFNQWKELLPYYSPGALGLTWQEGAQQVVSKQAGMFLLGSFVGQQFTTRRPRRPRLLPLPRDQPEVGAGLARRADRRLHALQGPKASTTPRRCSATSAAPQATTRTFRSTRTTARTGRRARRTTARCRRRRRR